MNTKIDKLNELQKDNGFIGDDKFVVELTSVELGSASYVEIVIDGVTVGSVKATK